MPGIHDTRCSGNGWPETVRHLIRGLSAGSRYIREKIWHKSRRILKNPDGSLEISFHVAGLKVIRRWVMGLGTEARMIEPESFKALVKAELIGALSYYKEPVESFQKQSIHNKTTDYTSGSRRRIS